MLDSNGLPLEGFLILINMKFVSNQEEILGLKNESGFKMSPERYHFVFVRRLHFKKRLKEEPTLELG